MRAVVFALLLSCVAGAGRAAVPADRPAPPGRCPAPEALVMPGRRLDQFSAAIAAGGPVRILAIGSGTTSGQDNSGNASYPRRMEDALRQDLPNTAIDLTVLGGLGMTATEMLQLIETELDAHHFALVVWQTGTVEAIHGVPPDTFEATLRTGAAKVRAAGADLVLVGPQFSRMLLARARLDPYTTVLEAVSAKPDRALFDRLTLTRSWIEDGRLDLAHATAKEDRQTMLELLHACVGDALARFLVNGAMRH